MLSVRSRCSRPEQMQMDGQTRTSAIQGVSGYLDDAILARILFWHIFVTSYAFQNELFDRFLNSMRRIPDWIANCIARFRLWTD